MYLCAAGLGLASYLGPAVPLLVREGQTSISGAVSAAVEAQGPATWFLLFLSGASVGLLGGQVSAWKVGLASVSLLALIAFVDILNNSQSHNLWPIEYVLYLLASLLPAAGVRVIRAIRH
jgi:hypothetical protein